MAFGDHVQSGDEYNQANAASTSVTLGATVTSGNLLIVTAGAYQNATDITFSDDKGNNYSVLQPVTYSNGYFTKVAYLINVTNAPQTITATPFPAGNYGFRVLAIDEFVGTTSALLDQTNQTLHQATTSVVTGNIFPSNNAALLYAATDNITFTTISGPGGIWTERQPAGTSGTCPFHAVMYAKQIIAAPIGGTFTYNAASSDGWGGILDFISAPFTPARFGLMGGQAW